MAHSFTLPSKYLVCINPDTNEVVERYLSISDAVKYNPNCNYNSLANSIYKQKEYKGLQWQWVYTDKPNKDNTDKEIRNEILTLIRSIHILQGLLE